MWMRLPRTLAPYALSWGLDYYDWYCNMGAVDRLGWCELFIRRAERLLLYHSSSADIPARGVKKRGMAIEDVSL